jgi:hypothetical protein
MFLEFKRQIAVSEYYNTEHGSSKLNSQQVSLEDAGFSD